MLKLLYFFQVVIYEDNREKARYNVLEEVKDLWLYAPFLFTVRDLDVTVTEIKPGEWVYTSWLSYKKHQRQLFTVLNANMSQAEVGNHE